MTNNMKTLTLQETKVIANARRLVIEMADELEAGPGAEAGMGDMGGMEDMGEMPPPSGETMPPEPPMSDSAVGASTSDNVALSLLREIRDLLADMAAEENAEEGAVPPVPEEGEGEGDETEGEAALDGEDEFKPGKRPMPVPSGVGGE